MTTIELNKRHLDALVAFTADSEVAAASLRNVYLSQILDFWKGTPAAALWATDGVAMCALLLLELPQAVAWTPGVYARDQFIHAIKNTTMKDEITLSFDQQGVGTFSAGHELTWSSYPGQQALDFGVLLAQMRDAVSGGPPADGAGLVTLSPVNLYRMSKISKSVDGGRILGDEGTPVDFVFGDGNDPVAWRVEGEHETWLGVMMPSKRIDAEETQEAPPPNDVSCPGVISSNEAGL